MKRLTQWLRRHRKQLFYTIILVFAIATTALVSYQAGQQNSAPPAKTTTKSTSPLFDTNYLKEAAKRADEAKSNITTTLKTSSGAFRLNGTVTTIGKDTITLTLTNKSTIVVATKSDTPYYEGKTKYTLGSLKRGTNVIATGAISSDGTFAVRAVQKSE